MPKPKRARRKPYRADRAHPAERRRDRGHDAEQARAGDRLARERLPGEETPVARIIVMPDAKHLKEGIEGPILYAEQIAPEHLDDLRSSEQILERLEGAVREEAGAVRTCS